MLHHTSTYYIDYRGPRYRYETAGIVVIILNRFAFEFLQLLLPAMRTTSMTTMRIKRSFRACIVLVSLLWLLSIFVIAQESSLDATPVNSTAGTEKQGSCSANDDTCTATVNEGVVAAVTSNEIDATDVAIANNQSICVDLSDECQELIDYGDCETHSDFVEENCRKSCAICFE